MSAESSSKTERLQVLLARYGVASRRGVVEFIESGKVTVNGEVVLEKGFRVDGMKDKITVDGQEIASNQPVLKRYFMFYKPKGVTTTMQDPHAESTVADFFKTIPERLCPVGRLDRDTTGLLLMTNDGEIAFRLTHPKFGIKKKYHALVEGFVTDAETAEIEKGVHLEEGETAPCKLEILNRNQRLTELNVTLHEGKKRQIRRIFEGIGHYVKELERTNYGPLSLGDLKMGHKKELSSQDIRSLLDVTGITKTSRK